MEGLEEVLAPWICWNMGLVSKDWDALARSQIEYECRNNPNQNFYFPLYWAAERGFKKLVRMTLESPAFCVVDDVCKEWDKISKVADFNGNKVLAYNHNSLRVDVANTRYALVKSAYSHAWRRGDANMVRFICQFPLMKFLIPPGMRKWSADTDNKFTMSIYDREKAIATYYERLAQYKECLAFVVRK